MNKNSVIIGLLAIGLSIVGATWRAKRQAGVSSSIPPSRLSSAKPSERTMPAEVMTNDLPPPAPGEFRWSQLYTNDYRGFIARLRATGCPEPTIQDIIIGAINRRFSPRIAALCAQESHFWDTLQRRKVSDQRAQMAREQEARKLERERAQLVQELFGIQIADYFSNSTGKPDRLTRSLADFSEAARSQARPLLEKYDQLENAVIQRANGTLGPSERKDLDQLYRQKVAELKQVLSPRELEEYELRASPTAEALRNSLLVGFSPTEQEFRQIFRIRRDFDEAYGSNWQSGDTADQWRLQLALQETADRIHQALGDARYADYQRSQDFTYRGLVEFTDYNGIPVETATQVHNMRENVIQQVDTLTSNENISDARRQAALKSIQAEAAKTVAQTLGPQVYQDYVNTPFGQWINLIPSWTNGVVFRH